MKRLIARFFNGYDDDGTPNYAKSKWVVCIGNDILLSLTVKEIMANHPSLSYKLIACKEFGERLIEKHKKMKAFW